MQQQFIKNVYNEYIYCDPQDYLLKPNNKLVRPLKPKPNSFSIHQRFDHVNWKDILTENEQSKQIPEQEHKTDTTPISTCNSSEKTPILDEEMFNQIELRGFINKQLLEQSLERGSNLFHIAEDVFEKLYQKYHEFKEIYHTLTTEFDNTVECIIETGKELGKKIAHIVYELYVAVMNKQI